MSNDFIAPDGYPRCQWCGGAPEFLPYHDNEWGFPVDDDQRLFEKLCLESFQSGLSWRIILNKRDNFRAAFLHFDFHQVAHFSEDDVQRLLQDAGIIRHRGKIEATINNAQRAKEMVEQEGSLAAFFWRYAPTALATPQTQTTSPESIAMAKELKKRGWKFFGPTTAFAFMQAMGLLNDHAETCIIRKKAAFASEAFTRPTKTNHPAA
ncbi:DNA-3-methyladenine glycosylase I [Halovibrio variabilis]|uniref:DNA-3-methyladenine glycosylase I n=1 Tax=Halovibrio variabilis TaxID=31910 RepID=A0A511UJ40_9GAMM|nr:DNA-3-methyladenine glycosylase I [Halovibrio variabilis]GEN26594.1 DNA-3-methyladenine glycosylase I [Halovibrio variabilis]